MSGDMGFNSGLLSLQHEGRQAGGMPVSFLNGLYTYHPSALNIYNKFQTIQPILMHIFTQQQIASASCKIINANGSMDEKVIGFVKAMFLAGMGESIWAILKGGADSETIAAFKRAFEHWSESNGIDGKFQAMTFEGSSFQSNAYRASSDAYAGLA